MVDVCKRPDTSEYMKIPPPIIHSDRAMARETSSGHQPAMQPAEGCGVKRLDAGGVQQGQRVSGHPDKRGAQAMKYVVTGINKLTGEREPVTKPYSEWKAREMRDKLAARQHCKSAYKCLKVEPADVEGNLW